MIDQIIKNQRFHIKQDIGFIARILMTLKLKFFITVFNVAYIPVPVIIQFTQDVIYRFNKLFVRVSLVHILFAVLFCICFKVLREQLVLKFYIVFQSVRWILLGRRGSIWCTIYNIKQYFQQRIIYKFFGLWYRFIVQYEVHLNCRENV